MIKLSHLSIIDNDKSKKNGKKSKDEQSELKAKQKFILSITEMVLVKKLVIQNIE